MHWTLIAFGVVAGIGLAFTRHWFERSTEHQEAEGSDGGEAAGSASAHETPPRHAPPPQASAAATDAQAESEAAEATPATEAAAFKPMAEPDTDAAAEPIAEASPQAASTEPPVSEPEASAPGVSDGERVEAALASADLSVMEAVLQETEDPIHRNLLLNRLVAGHYRSRSEPEHREAFYRVARIQIEEASTILDAVEAMGRPRPDHIEAFKSIAIALDEDKRYDEAIAISEQALSLGLKDGTKTGFEGRITRLKKSRDS